MHLVCRHRRGHDLRWRLPPLSPVQAERLQNALESVPIAGIDDDTVVFEVPRGFADWQRGVARAVVGTTAVVAAFLLMGLVVVGSDTRGAVAALCAVTAATGAITVWWAWHRDVGLVVSADGSLRRTGWDGIAEIAGRDVAAVEVVS